MNGRLKRIAMAGVAGLASITVATAVAATKDKTFSSGTISTGVPDEGVAVRTLKVKTKGKIKDINASVSLTTTSNQDMTFLLRHPSGKTIHLSSGNGGSGNGYGTNGCGNPVTFDDEAADPVEDTEGVDTLFEGSYQPEQVDTNGNGGLSELDGKKLNGKWQLVVVDTDEFAGGTLRCFKLEAKYKTA